ncbi:MAG: type II toxin-antitoxin system HicB family antitoxin [Calditrichaeota bacterium]|nr:MAG: type II toxin-antitoxin system HicB family antitoxin [Calditrichota bacterium]
MKLRIVVRKVEANLYIASCPELEGCHVEADTEQGARALIKKAINAYVISYKQRHEKLPLRTEGK